MRIPRICIVILSYDNSINLPRCLKSIMKTKNQNFWVIIIDNGSLPPIKKDSFSYFRGRITILRSGKNLGYAEANNYAIEYALNHLLPIDFFLLLNDDVYLPSDFFSKSILHLDNNVDMLSPVVLLDEDRGVDAQGIDYYTDGFASNRIISNKHAYLLSAACLFISNNFAAGCVSKLGFVFIPDYFAYYEDVELSLRALLMERHIKLLPSQVFHTKSSTQRNESLITFYSLRNQLWVIITTWTSMMIAKNFFRIAKGQFELIILLMLHRDFILLMRIYCETIHHLPRLLAKRKIIQKHIVVSYPNNLLSNNPVVLKDHIIQSKTYRFLIKRLFTRINFKEIS